MARAVFTGWRIVTPGPCHECGCDSDWTCDGRGRVLCSCDPECDESFDGTEAGAVLFDLAPQPAAGLDG